MTRIAMGLGAALAAAALSLSVSDAAAQAGVPIQSFEHRLVPLLGKKPDPARRLGVVEDDKGSISVFRMGHAIVRVPEGSDLDAHLAQAGLTLVDRRSPAKGSYTYPERGKGPGTALQSRKRGALPQVLDRTALVSFPLGQVDLAGFLAALEREGTRSRLKAASHEDAIRTLAFIAGYREKFGKRGFRMVMDQAVFPFQLLDTTSEDPLAYCNGTCGDSLSDPYWAITNMRRAWQLAQVADTPFNDPLEGFSDGTPSVAIGTVQGPPILAIVDTGFATTDADHSPDIIFTWGTPIGGPGATNFHGTRVSSAAASPVNDGAGVAGSSVYSRNSSVPRLHERAQMALMWAELEEMSFWSLSHTIIAAIGGGADVVNVSMGNECDFWCRAFGFGDELSLMTDALAFADSQNVSIVTSAGNGPTNSCGAQLQDLAETFIIPCAMAHHNPVCVGAIDRSERNACNFGPSVDVWAPGRDVWVTASPGSSGVQQRSGSSIASPFVAGVVAMAVGAAGRSLSSSEVDAALRATSRASSDPRAPRILDAYAFLRRFVNVRADAFEPNNSWDNVTGPVTEPNLLSTRMPYGIGTGTPDVDWLNIPADNACSTLRFDVRFVTDPAAGEMEASVEYGPWSTGMVISEDVRRFEFPTVRDRGWPLDQRLVGLRTQGALPTGYHIFNIAIRPNPFPGGEGPQDPATCNGRDDDCDGVIDEGFPDTDGDGIADCVDPDIDNDCVLNASDNCPLVRNAHQFCAMADNPERLPLRSSRGCGDRACANVRVDNEVSGIGASIGNCFRQFPPEKNCFTDGCPFPGPMIHPKIAAVVRDAMTLRNQLRASPAHYEAVRPAFGVLDGFRATPDGRVIVPPELAPKAGGPTVTLAGTSPDAKAVQARIAAIEGAPSCKPVFSFDKRLGAAQGRVVNCWRSVMAKPCQLDTNNDGTGDACQGP